MRTSLQTQLSLLQLRNYATESVDMILIILKRRHINEVSAFYLLACFFWCHSKFKKQKKNILPCCFITVCTRVCPETCLCQLGSSSIFLVLLILPLLYMYYIHVCCTNRPLVYSKETGKLAHPCRQVSWLSWRHQDRTLLYTSQLHFVLSSVFSNRR